jgi:hypothetical protein
MKISTILDQIDLGGMALPEFQRGYVWNREQVRGLMESLYRDHPVGTLLVWTTQPENAKTRSDQQLAGSPVKLILDGQQRITSLYGIIRGKPPQFFEGNAGAFLDLYYNVDEELFEFYGPVKMKNDPAWISVTDLMQHGPGQFISAMTKRENPPLDINTYVNRLTRIVNIKERDLHIEEVTGEDKSVDVVVDIFNRVNSGGTKLSKGDLALARIGAEWPGAREAMNARIERWHNHGFDFKLEWLLRCVNTYTTGEALFTALRNVSTQAVEDALPVVEQYVNYLLNLIGSRLGLDHDRVLGSRYSFATLMRLLRMKGGQLDHPKERDRLLYWYIHTFLWGRYTGSTESIINQDLEAIEGSDQPVEALIELLRQNRGDLKISPNDFVAWSRGARFYPLLYMLTRVWHARDWETGIELANHTLGAQSQLHMHHIFPKALLYEHGYGKREVNSLANFTFLTQDTNLKVSDRDPAEYLAVYAQKDPSLLESHWIPTDPDLWKLENYELFLEKRRALLAQAANDFLDHLRGGDVPERELLRAASAEMAGVPGSIETDDERAQLNEVNTWVQQQGYAPGELSHELVDGQSGMPVVLIDLAWPEGLQPGLSEPVALLIDEDQETEEIVGQAGFRFFTSVEALKAYVGHKRSTAPTVS